jgi:hypothetical protein
MTDETTTVDDAQDSADFDAGFEGKPAEPATKKPEPAEAPREEAAPAPEYVQVTAKEWAEIKAVAAKTASYDQQLSRLFGTTGNIQKLLNESKAQAAQSATPTARKVELPKDAFAQMEKDFPELAQQTRAALEAALSGIPGSGGADIDPAKIETMLASYTSKREIESLEDDHPDWRQIVGAVDITKEQPDPNHPFRKWLSTKDAAYQTRVNGTESAAVIAKAIRTFQNETKALQKPPVTPRTDARADRIRSAVQPRGDNAPVTTGKNDDDEFMAGFNSR